MSPAISRLFSSLWSSGRQLRWELLWSGWFPDAYGFFPALSLYDSSALWLLFLNNLSDINFPSLKRDKGLGESRQEDALKALLSHRSFCCLFQGLVYNICVQTNVSYLSIPKWSLCMKCNRWLPAAFSQRHCPLLRQSCGSRSCTPRCRGISRCTCNGTDLKSQASFKCKKTKKSIIALFA